MLINSTDWERLIDVQDLIRDYWPASKEQLLATHILKMVLHPNHCQAAGCSGHPHAAEPTHTDPQVVPTAVLGVPKPPPPPAPERVTVGLPCWPPKKLKPYHL